MIPILEKLSLSLILGLSAVPSSEDPLASLPTEPIDIELKQVPVQDVMILVEDIAGRAVVLDACVQGSVSLKLEAVTVRTFLEVLGESLALDYGRNANGDLTVGCDGSKPAARRVDLSVVDAPLSEVLGVLATEGELSIDAVSCDGVSVDLDVRNAPVPAVVHAIAGQANAVVEVTAGGARLAMRC